MSSRFVYLHSTTILTICSPDSRHKKAMTVSSNMGSNSGSVIKSFS